MPPLVLLLATLASAGTITMDGAVWKQFLPPDDPEEETGPGPAVTWRDVRIEPRKEEVFFTARYKIHTVEPGWFDGVLASPGVEIKSARWNNTAAATTTSANGTTITAWVDGDVELLVTGVIAGDATRSAVPVGLLEAATGRVTVETDDQPVVTATAAISEVSGTFWTGARDLQVRTKPREKPGPKPNLVIGQVGIGATLLDSEFVIKSHIRWGVVQGEVSQVSFTASGAGRDLTVEGRQISEWDRSGDRVTVTLLEPEKGAVDVDVRWTAGVPAGDEARVALPQIQTENTFRSEASLQLARDGELELVPDLDGWSGIASSALPDWGSGLVEGTPTAAYTATSSGGGTLGLFRFTPVSGPPTFVDVAAYNIAATAEGRTLVRAHYQVRNERGALLRVVPPPNTQIVGARVAGKTAVVGIDGDAWLLPLDKSVETVDGLLSFGVEVILLGDGIDWKNNDIRELPLPTVDAPIAVVRATLHLPPTYENKLDEGEGGTVADFTEGEGITYGAAIGDVDAAQADAIFQEAVTAWMDNDFDSVQDNLDALKQMDAANENIDKLQANVDLISGKSSSASVGGGGGGGGGGGSIALERRVKEQAKARSYKDKAAQEEVLKAAEAAELAGDYAEAERSYAAALELGDKLEKLEQKENVDVSMDNSRLSQRLKNVSDEKKKRKTIADPKPQVQVSEQLIVITGEVQKPAITELSDLSDDSGRDEYRDELQSVEKEVEELKDRVFREKADLKQLKEIIIDGQPIENAPVSGTTVQDPADQRGDSFHTVTELDFGEVTVEGMLTQPDGASVSFWSDEPAEPNAPSPDPSIELPSGAHTVAVDEDVLEEEPVIDDFGMDQTLAPMAEMSRRRIRIPTPRIRFGGGQKVDQVPMTVDAPPPPPPPPPPDPKPSSKRPSKPANIPGTAGPVRGAQPDPEPLEVRATTLSVVIPSQGETVRYQHLLLEADAEFALQIHAKKSRRDS